MKRKAYGRDAGLTLRMLFTGSLLGLLYVFFARRALLRPQRGLVPMLVIVVGLAFFQYFTSDKLALARRRREGRRARRGAGAARHDRAARGDGRPAEAARRDHRHGRARTHSRPAATRSTRPSPSRPASGSRLEPQEIEGVLAHELSHIANRDVLVMTRRQLLRDARRPADALRALRRACSAAAAAATTTTARCRSG